MSIRGGNWNNGSSAGFGYSNGNNWSFGNTNSNNGGGRVDSRNTKKAKREISVPLREGSSIGRKNIVPPSGVVAVRFRQEWGVRMYFGRTRVDLWPMVYDLDNIYSAYLEVAKGKRYHRDFQEFSLNLEENLIGIHNDLVWRTYEPGPVVSFVIYEPKKRLITRPQLRDRIVHHALIRVIKRIYEHEYHRHSYACHEGRGQLAACLEVCHMERQALNAYGWSFGVFYLDIKSYFKSIDHPTAKILIREVFNDDPDIVWLCDKIIDAVSEGLPIGFLTSQYEANLIGTTLDRHLDGLGVLYHVRYMDDIIGFTRTRCEAKEVVAKMDEYCAERLLLKLNEKKSRTEPFRGKVTFCGYVCAPHHLEPKHATVKRGERRIRKKERQFLSGELTAEELRQSARSLNAYLSHTSEKRNQVADEAIAMAGTKGVITQEQYDDIVKTDA